MADRPDDTYLTLADSCEGIYKEKGSKFIAYAFSVSSREQIKDRQEEVRKLHHSARHHCYAWMLGPKGSESRANDDGEPSNSAGKPILGQIQSHSITDVLIIVVRYFGGVKLGVGGLINAYRSAAADALQNGTIVERIVMIPHHIRFEYPAMNAVMTVLKQDGISIREQDFAVNCLIRFEVRLSRESEVLQKLRGIDDILLDD